MSLPAVLHDIELNLAIQKLQHSHSPRLLARPTRHAPGLDELGLQIQVQIVVLVASLSKPLAAPDRISAELVRLQSRLVVIGCSIQVLLAAPVLGAVVLVLEQRPLLVP